MTIPEKLARYRSFAIILMNDEESLDSIELPPELNPSLSRENFMNVCFIFSMARLPQQPTGPLDADNFMNETSQRILRKLSPLPACDNGILISDNKSHKCLSFLLGLILAKQALNRTLIVCRNPKQIELELSFLAQSGCQSAPKFCFIQHFVENRDQVVTQTLLSPEPQVVKQTTFRMS